MTHSSALTMYTIYERPDDYPELFVVRESFVTQAGVIQGKIMGLATTLSEARAFVPDDLYRQPRLPGDLSSVVESWF